MASAQVKRTINVETAGTLPSLISEEEKYTIEELTLTGNLNGTDFRLLRDMAGNNYQGEITEGKLKILDLSGARIVEGGDPYIEASSIKTTVGATMFPIYGSKYSTSTDVITYYMFAGCNFQSINLPAAITSIHFYAFAYCVNLESISIPDKVTYLETSAFEGCRKLASIWIPKSVSTLYGSSLDGGSLTSIVVEDGNPKYDSRDNCNAVIETENNKLIIGCKGSTIPNTVTSIGMQAFFACQLTSITIPSSVNTIEYGAFDESTITSIIIPSTVTSIGINIFSRCKQLTSIVVEKGNPNYDSRDNSNAIIETATNKLIATCKNTIVPSSVTELGEYTFSQWKELPSDLLKYIKTICANAFDNALFASIVIPEGVESIGKEAFRNCNVMKTISLPASLKTIGDNVFSSCYNMIEIYSHNSNPSDISEKVFNYQIWDSSTHKYVPFSSKATLYVPAGTKEKYQAAEGWKEFTNIVEMETKGFAVFDPATGTLTFKYGDYMPGDNVYETDETHFDGTWDCSKIKKVVFDPSFANARPQSTAFWFYEAKSLTEIEDIQYLNTSNVTNMYCMFYECSSLTSLDVSHFDTSNVINMEAMFCRCSSLTSLDVSHFNTSNVTSMGGMFDGCSGLTSLDVSNFKTDNVIYIGGMFHYCSGLTNLDVSNFDTGNVTDMSSMFECCSSLTGLDVSNFNTNNVTDMRHMFSSCEGLTVLDVSNFDTGNVADMSYMFQSCVGLTNIDISSFDTKNVTDISGMFNFCNALTTILVSEKWSTANVTSCEDMFKNCNKLVGGKGTVYDAEHIDAAYARIDGGADAPGYFTEKVTVSITIGKSGKASYCGNKSLDFSFSDEVKAYIATGFDKDEGTIWLTRVKDVPAGVPVLIKGEAEKTYDVPVTDSENSYYKNMFVGNRSGATIQITETDGDMVNYYLSGDGSFKSVNNYANIANNKCYLQLPGTFAPAEAGATQTVTVGSSGKASFAAPVDLDFTNVEGLKAFTATGYDKSTKTIWLTRVMKVQKGEGVLLKGDAKDYKIPSAAVQSSYMNMFVGNTSGASVQVQETSADGAQTNFYLKGDGTFVSVNGYVNIGNNKCYLALPTDMVSTASTRGAEANYILDEPEVIKLPISFRSLDNDGNGTTAIRETKQSREDGAYYTLQGQRVVNPGKGLYIHNGKKVVIK